VLKAINYKFYKNEKIVGEITLSKKHLASKSDFFISLGVKYRKLTKDHVIHLAKIKKPTHFSINDCPIIKFEKKRFSTYFVPKRKYQVKTILNNPYLPFANPLKQQLKPVKCK